MKFLVLAVALLAVAFACVDKKDNVVKVADVSGGNLNVHFQNVVAAIYDSNGNPSCVGNRPNLKTPGIIKLISGQATIKKQMQLEKSGSLMATLKKDSWLIGTVCKDGKSRNALVPDKDCQIDLCGEASKLGHGGLCKLLETPGVHTLGEVEGDIQGFNGTIPLPKITGVIEGILKGSWQAEFKLVSNGETVAHIKAPSNEEWINIDA